MSREASSATVKETRNRGNMVSELLCFWQDSAALRIAIGHLSSAKGRGIGFSLGLRYVQRQNEFRKKAVNLKGTLMSRTLL